MRRLYRLLDTVGIGLILLLLLAFFSVQADGFFSVANLSNIMVQASVIMIIATGMTFVISAAEIDLSVGSLMALCGMITALTLRVDPESGMNIPMWFGSLVGEPYSALWWIVASVVFLAAALLPGVVWCAQFYCDAWFYDDIPGIGTLSDGCFTGLWDAHFIHEF
jgi:ribose transport system permease protein